MAAWLLDLAIHCSFDFPVLYSTLLRWYRTTWAFRLNVFFRTILKFSSCSLNFTPFYSLYRFDEHLYSSLLALHMLPASYAGVDCGWVKTSWLLLHIWVSLNICKQVRFDQANRGLFFVCLFLSFSSSTKVKFGTKLQSNPCIGEKITHQKWKFNFDQFNKEKSRVHEQSDIMAQFLIITLLVGSWSRSLHDESISQRESNHHKHSLAFALFHGSPLHQCSFGFTRENHQHKSSSGFATPPWESN